MVVHSSWAGQVQKMNKLLLFDVDTTLFNVRMPDLLKFKVHFGLPQQSTSSSMSKSLTNQIKVGGAL